MGESEPAFNVDIIRDTYVAIRRAGLLQAVFLISFEIRIQGEEFRIKGVESGIQGVESGIQGVESGIQEVKSGIQGVESGIQVGGIRVCFTITQRFQYFRMENKWNTHFWSTQPENYRNKRFA